MSTKIWIDDKMYLVDGPVRVHVDELQAELATYRWIPAEERLPGEKDKRIIVANNRVLTMSCLQWGNTDLEVQSLKRFFTHWKPIILPEGD